MLKNNVKEIADKIYKELEGKLKDFAKDSWDELHEPILFFSTRLATLQVEKAVNKKITTDLDIAYLSNVAYPAIERIIRGRVEDEANAVWDYAKNILDSLVEQSVKLATIALKTYVGGIA